MNQDPDRISNALNFLTKMLEKCENKDKKKERREEEDGERKLLGEIFSIYSFKRDQDNIFYLVKCPELDGKSLLSYINSQNVRFVRQREELIDLSVKMRDEFPREACRDCLWS